MAKNVNLWRVIHTKDEELDAKEFAVKRLINCLFHALSGPRKAGRGIEEISSQLITVLQELPDGPYQLRSLVNEAKEAEVTKLRDALTKPDGSLDLQKAKGFIKKKPELKGAVQAAAIFHYAKIVEYRHPYEAVVEDGKLSTCSEQEAGERTLTFIAGRVNKKERAHFKGAATLFANLGILAKRKDEDGNTLTAVEIAKRCYHEGQRHMEEALERNKSLRKYAERLEKRNSGPSRRVVKLD